MPGTSLHQIHLTPFRIQQIQQNESFYSGLPLVCEKESKGRKKELEGFIIPFATLEGGDLPGCKAGGAKQGQSWWDIQRKLSLRRYWDITSPKAVGTPSLRDIQISGGQIPKKPDLPWDLPLPWAGVLDQINSSSNLKYSMTSSKLKQE